MFRPPRDSIEYQCVADRFHLSLISAAVIFISNRSSRKTLESLFLGVLAGFAVKMVRSRL